MSRASNFLGLRAVQARVQAMSAQTLLLLLGVMLLPVHMVTDLYLGRPGMTGTLISVTLLLVAGAATRLRSRLTDYVLAGRGHRRSRRTHGGLSPAPVAA